ncbi:MAG: LysR family transcriptional regulator [Gemmatimonadota bacterium]
MDLKALQAFIAVVRKGSFAAAARSTRVPKSTLSKRVQDLEASLGQRLLERNTRNLRLTTEGAMLLERAEWLVSEASEIERLIRDRDTLPRGRLRVSVPILFGQCFMGQLAAAYSRAWPETRIEVMLSDRPVDPIEEDFDCAIRVGPLDDSSLVGRTVAYSQSRVVASPSLLERFPPPEDPEDLVTWPTIALSFAGDPARWSLEREDTRIDVTPHGPITLNNIFAVRAAVLAGAGAALIPEFLIADDIREGVVLPLLDSWRTARVELWLIYPRRRQTSARLRAFIETVASRFPDRTLST